MAVRDGVGTDLSACVKSRSEERVHEEMEADHTVRHVDLVCNEVMATSIRFYVRDCLIISVRAPQDYHASTWMRDS